MGEIHLTQKQTRALSLQLFGTAKGLEAEPNAPVGYYHKRFGGLGVRIHPDICGSGCIIIEVQLSGGIGTSTQYYDPVTLQENFEIEEHYSRNEKQDRLKERADELGTELAYKIRRLIALGIRKGGEV